MTQREQGARRLLQFLGVDLVGDCLDAIGDERVRRGLRQVAALLRTIADDAADYERSHSMGGTVALSTLATPPTEPRK